MSVATPAFSPAAEARVIGALGKRALRGQFRRAQLLMPTFVLPLMLLAVIASGTSPAQGLDAFPEVESYLSFVIAGTVLQGALLAGLTAGTALASDIEFGFFDRLIAAPIHRTSLVLGRLAGTFALAILQSSFFLAIGLIFGGNYPGGVLGVLGTVALAALTAMAIGGVTATIAIRTGSMALLQSIFPFIFIFLFTAPAFFPRDLITPALHDVATYNPLTYVVEAMRALLLGDSALGDVWVGVGAAVGLVLVATAMATLALRVRLRRT